MPSSQLHYLPLSATFFSILVGMFTLLVLFIQLGFLRKRLLDRNMELTLDDKARDLLGAAGFDPVYGARPLKRAIQQQVENPLAQKISSHPQLATRVKAMLPSGMTLNSASDGFKNQGQFIAALHVSQNLKIPFATLKSTILGTSTTGTTGSTTGTTTSTTGSTTTTTSSPMSLGQAIHKLRSTTDATAAATTATQQATSDLNSTTSK